MNNVDVFFGNGEKTASIKPLETSRDWMKINKYAFNCMPVALTNKMGYGVSFDEDISFVWNGSDAMGQDGDIEVLSGKDYCYFDRGGGVIGFPTNLVFKTNEDLSILTMPVPNQFIDGLQAFTSIISSSFYTGQLHIVCRVTSSNKVIEIKAGTPIASILPINLSSLQDTTLNIKNKRYSDALHSSGDYIKAMTEYGRVNGRPSDWYKRAVDHNGISVGSHEVDAFKFNVVYDQ